MQSEYNIANTQPWVRPLEEEDPSLPPGEASPTAGELVLEGYTIVFDKKIALVPVDLEALPNAEPNPLAP
jgi:hypothetical protein